jgi:hypothetical protein
MLTGLRPLATIRVSAMRMALLALCLPLGCGAPDAPASIRESVTDFICEGSCLQERFRYFSGQSVHLEVEPTGAMSQVIYNIDPQDLKSRPIVLNKVVKVSGTASGAESYLGNPSAEHDNSGAFQDILAIPVTNMIRFLSPRIQSVKAKLIVDTDKKPSYEINLFSEIPYTLILNPSGKLDRAPVHINAGIMNSDGVFNFDITTTTIQLNGHVISNDTDLFSAQTNPIMRARVLQGDRLISAVGPVQKDGSFSIEISKPLFDDPINQPIALMIEPIAQDAPLPRLKVRLDKEQLTENLDVGDIDLGTLKKPISVTFDIHGSDDSNIGNAFLYLRAKIGAGETIVKKQVNNKGKTSVENMYEGSYDIAVVPPTDSPFAMRVIKNVELDSMENGELSIDLQRRNRIDAIVVGPTGKALSGAQLELSRIGEIGVVSADDIYEDNHFKFTAATNDEGKVCHRKFGFVTTDKNECADLLLDDGRYLAHIIPPAGTELSHKWIMFDFPEHNKFSIRIDHPEILGGQILATDGKTPIRHAFVTVYLAETRVHNQAKVIGTAMTDEKGYFRAFVSTPH